MQAEASGDCPEIFSHLVTWTTVNRQQTTQISIVTVHMTHNSHHLYIKNVLKSVKIKVKS